MEKIQIKKLESKKDLELLVEGNKVNVELQHVKGIITFFTQKGGVFIFIKRDNKRILRYDIEQGNIDVRDNKIIQKRDSTYGNPEIFEKGPAYEVYSELIGEPD